MANQRKSCKASLSESPGEHTLNKNHHSVTDHKTGGLLETKNVTMNKSEFGSPRIFSTILTPLFLKTGSTKVSIVNSDDFLDYVSQ